MELITLSTETGVEMESSIADHLEQWHNWASDQKWDDAHLTRVHDTEHAGSSEFDYHAHPVG